MKLSVIKLKKNVVLAEGGLKDNVRLARWTLLVLLFVAL